MNAVIAALLLGSFFVLFRLAFRAYRRPDAAAWTRRGMTGELVCVGLVGLLSVGLTLAAREVGTVLNGGLGLVETLLVLAVVAVTVVLWRLVPAPKGEPAAVVDLPRDPRPSAPVAGGAGRPRKKAA